MKLGALFADVLLVGTQPDFIKAIRSVLQAAGYVVRSAGRDQTLTEDVRARPPDLIVLDSESPGLDGCDLVRRLKAEALLPFIPVLMVTPRAQPQAMAASLNAGADEVIGWPIDNAELLTRVRAMLRLKASSDSLAALNVTLEQKVIERTRELEEAHARLRHAEKLSSLGRLAASIAHEINNPLSGILNYAYLIKAELPADSAVQEDMAMIERQINAIARLVQRLRDFSKPPRKERRLVSLNRVVEEVLALTGKDLEKHRIQVVRELADALPFVLASAEQMQEVLLNLVINARDAMADGGVLTVRTNADDNHVRLEVADTGSGIPPDVKDRLFEPFFTTKGEQGTGLGLAICHSVVHDHKGEICVESQEGQGTLFCVQLLAHDAVENVI